MELPPDVQSPHFSMSFFDLEGPMHRNSALDFEIIAYFKSGLYFSLKVNNVIPAETAE